MLIVARRIPGTSLGYPSVVSGILITRYYYSGCSEVFRTLDCVALRDAHECNSATEQKPFFCAGSQSYVGSHRRNARSLLVLVVFRVVSLRARG